MHEVFARLAVLPEIPAIQAAFPCPFGIIDHGTLLPRRNKQSLKVAFQKSAEDYFDRTLDLVQDDDPCKELLKLLSHINQQCTRFLHFSSVIKDVAKLDYSQLTLSTFDRMVRVMGYSISFE